MFMEMLCRVKLVVALVIIQIGIIVLVLQRNTGCVLIAGRPRFKYVCDETTRVIAGAPWLSHEPNSPYRPPYNSGTRTTNKSR
jgi:hypothetical protein